MDINSNQFNTYLRSALHHLYEPDQLRLSPLTTLFGIAGRIEASTALQKILLQAIEDIRPGDGESPQSQGWITYEVLFFRYVRGYSRQAVADQLGISERQLSRDQRAALETLAQYLWHTYRLEDSANPPSSLPQTAQAETPGLIASASAQDESKDHPWIIELPAEKPSAWKQTILSVLDLLRPLARQHLVELIFEPAESLSDLLVPQNALRHSLLNILGLMIPAAREGKLLINPSLDDQVLNLSITALPGDGIEPCADVLFTGHANLAVAQQLLERTGGVLYPIQLGGGNISLSIPAMAQIPVLIIDDNPDMIQLFQRYSQGTRYSVVGAPGPVEFFQLLETIQPRIVLLDVMMPELDGWDMLSQLRQEKHIQNIAILICSILPQENLARSLGADGFLQKPVYPQDFIQALDDQMSQFSGKPAQG
jgi:CheY-like chemotaxis protein